MSAKLVQVIEVVIVKGEGTKDDPLCTVVEYYSPSGKLLAVRDDGAASGPHNNSRCCCWLHRNNQQ